MFLRDREYNWIGTPMFESLQEVSNDSQWSRKV